MHDRWQVIVIIKGTVCGMLVLMGIVGLRYPQPINEQFPKQYGTDPDLSSLVAHTSEMYFPTVIQNKWMNK